MSTMNFDKAIPDRHPGGRSCAMVIASFTIGLSTTLYTLYLIGAHH